MPVSHTAGSFLTALSQQGRCLPIHLSPTVLTASRPVRQRHEPAQTDDLFWRRLLLHLPRLPMAEEAATNTIAAEAERISEQVLKTAGLGMRRVDRRATIEDVRFGVVEDALAVSVLSRYHYLQNARPEARAFGLFRTRDTTELSLLAVATFSPLDAATLVATLPEYLPANQVLMLSRLFAFSDAPENALSYLIGRCIRELRRSMRSFRLLFTYLDPNIGYSGAAYRAMGAYLYGAEAHAPFLYLDGNHVTIRQMVNAYGTATLQHLHAVLGNRIATSQCELAPLEIYAMRLDRKLPHLVAPSLPMTRLVGKP